MRLIWLGAGNSRAGGAYVCLGTFQFLTITPASTCTDYADVGLQARVVSYICADYRTPRHGDPFDDGRGTAFTTCIPQYDCSRVEPLAKGTQSQCYRKVKPHVEKMKFMSLPVIRQLPKQIIGLPQPYQQVTASAPGKVRTSQCPSKMESSYTKHLPENIYQ